MRPMMRRRSKYWQRRMKVLYDPSSCKEKFNEQTVTDRIQTTVEKLSEQLGAKKYPEAKETTITLRYYYNIRHKIGQKT